MASGQNNTNNNAVPPHFILTPQQQNLLFRALTSNQPNANPSALANDPLSLSPGCLQNSSPAITSQGYQESPFLDYDYDIGPDNTFDFDFITNDQARMIGDLPGTSPVAKDTNVAKSNASDQESSDKRSHPDEDGAETEEGGGKRRESESKTNKKPGRKPLTNEPTSKRKAQNRAAQRAFRERKEKHLQDLENKVEELEQASASANNENAQLRSQIDKLTVQLAEYKKRLTQVNATGRSVSARNAQAGFGSAAVHNLNDVNFHFEFPKFGSVQAPQAQAAAAQQKPAGDRTYPSPSVSTGSQNSPAASSKQYQSTGNAKSRSSSDALPKDSTFKPQPLVTSSPLYDNLFGTSTSRTSLDSASFSLNGGHTASPSASSNSNGGPSSSCGTSPEPCTQSPLGFKPVDTLTTIGEEQPTLTTSNLSSFANMDNIDFNLGWLSQQNGGQFDPQLFGDYREPQENILANPAFDDSFFNDAFEIDFTTPYNMAPSPNVPKKNLIAEIDERKESEDTIATTVNGKLLTCSNIWEKLQTCPKVQNGDLDLDGLCSDLQKKAKCGGTGAVVDEHDFKTIMTKYLGPEDIKNCPDAA